MLFFNALGLVLLPLASARPHAESTPYTTGSALEARKVLSEADVDSQFNFVPWEFRNICLDCARNSTDVQYSCKTKFDWSDPNSVPENNVTSGTCNSGAWEWDGTAVSAGGKVSYPSANTVCYSQGPLNYLQFRFVGFSNAENFTVEIVHRYMDDQNFSAPWDHPTTFTSPSFNLTVAKSTNMSIVSYSRGVQYSKVTGVSD